MKNIRNEIAHWIHATLFIGLWLLLLYFSGEAPGITQAALSKIPDVVLIYAVLYLLFTNWLWRLPIFSAWLVPFPDLQGTWKGTLTSTWIDVTTGRPPDPIPIVLAIRHTFTSLSCVIHTKESSSVSTAASFQIDEHSEMQSISYVYTNTPRVSVRDRSVVHDGAAKLRLSSGSELRLEGEYWTNRNSTGEMILKRVSSTVATAFD